MAYSQNVQSEIFMKKLTGNLLFLGWLLAIWNASAPINDICSKSTFVFWISRSDSKTMNPILRIKISYWSFENKSWFSITWWFQKIQFIVLRVFFLSSKSFTSDRYFQAYFACWKNHCIVSRVDLLFKMGSFFSGVFCFQKIKAFFVAQTIILAFFITHRVISVFFELLKSYWCFS